MERIRKSKPVMYLFMDIFFLYFTLCFYVFGEMLWSLQSMMIPANHFPLLDRIAGLPRQSTVPSRVHASSPALNFT